MTALRYRGTAVAKVVWSLCEVREAAHMMPKRLAIAGLLGLQSCVATMATRKMIDQMRTASYHGCIVIEAADRSIPES